MSEIQHSVESFFDELDTTTGYRASGLADEQPAQDRDSHPAEPKWSPAEEQAHYEHWCHREAERVTRQLEAVAAEVVREAAKPAPSVAQVNRDELAAIKSAGSFVGSLKAVAKAAEQRRELASGSVIDQAHAAALAEDRARQNGMRRSSSRTVSRFASSSRR